MHKIDIKDNNLRTDLLIEQNKAKLNTEKITEYKNIKVHSTDFNNKNYTTIFFKDITDKDDYNNVLKIFVKELKKYITITRDDVILIIGLGNNKSTPDSLGPLVVDNILVTRYLFLLGEVEEGYNNVCSFKPNVTGNTGIETADIIKSIIKQSNASLVITIDALKASNVARLMKTIQITNSGINPGSGVNNNRKEISKKTMNVPIIAIGVPTVVDAKTIVENILERKVSLKENLIVTPTNIDFIIEKMAHLIADGINISLHKNFKRQNTA